MRNMTYFRNTVQITITICFLVKSSDHMIRQKTKVVCFHLHLNIFIGTVGWQFFFHKLFFNVQTISQL